MKIEQARDIVDALINDLRDRSGLGNEWEQIDKETQDEIIATWVYIVGIKG